MNFIYRVVDKSGQILEGSLQAEDLASARAQLKGKGYIILELTPGEKRRLIEVVKGFFYTKKVKDEVLYSFFREFSILLKSGITVDKALEILIKSFKEVTLKESLTRILQALKEGQSLSQAFKEEVIFNPLIISIISAGEKIGGLSQAFENIADYLKFQIQFKNEIKNTLAYPLFLILASFITLFVIFKFILPRFFSVFGEVMLPLPAKILIILGYIFTEKGLLAIVLGLTTLLILSYFGYLRLPWKYLNFIPNKLPLIKTILRDLDFARFCYGMHSMLKGGLEFIDALYLSKNLLRSERFKNKIEEIIYEIKKGVSISEAFVKNGPWPEIFYHMLKVGEETATLKDIFYELHNIFDEKFKTSVKRLLSLIEPIVITVTGIIVGFIVISLILTVMGAGVIRF